MEVERRSSSVSPIRNMNDDLHENRKHTQTATLSMHDASAAEH